jgi:hypothetical protein
VRLKAYSLILTLNGLRLPLAAAFLWRIKPLNKPLSRGVSIAVLELIERLLADLFLERSISFTDEFLLYLLEDLLFSLLESFDVPVGSDFDDFFDLVDEDIEVEDGHFVIDPVGLALVESLDDFMKLLILTLAIVLHQFDEIAVLKVAAHPIALLTIFQYAVPFKYVVFKLTHIEVPVFEHLLPHPVQLCVHVVPSFHKSQLKVILVSVGVGVVPSLGTSVDEVKPQTINESVFLEAYNYAVSLFLHLD